MSEKLLHGQMSVVDENGDVTLIHQETSASDVLVTINDNTQGTNGSSAIPSDVDNLQKLTDKLGSLAFKSIIDTSDLTDDSIVNNYTTTEAGHSLDARAGKDLNDRLVEIEDSALIIGIDEEIDSDLITPESEINDNVTSNESTWSSKKISDIFEELNDNSHIFYVRLTEDVNGNYISHTAVTDIELAYIAGKAIWVAASNVFIPLRQRINANTWIFSGYTEEKAFDITVTATGVTFAYTEVATVKRLTTTVELLEQTVDERLKVIEGDSKTDGSIEKALADAKKYTDEIKDSLSYDIDNATNKIFQVSSLDDITDTDIKTGDVAIVKSTIYADASNPSNNKYSYTGYVFNNGNWAAMDGNYNANNVYFDDDFTFTTKIGTVQTLTNGSAKVPAAGKSVKSFLASIFGVEGYPKATAPSVSWNTDPSGTFEVGTEITPKYNAKLNAGSYTYGPATGITAKSWVIDIADLSDSNKTTGSGSFSTFTATDGMDGYAKITATASYDAGAVPLTNFSNPYKSVQIPAGSKSATSAGYTSYRAWFYGYKDGNSKLNITNIGSDNIRGLTSVNGSFPSSIETNKMQQMFFAAPAGIIKSIAVSHSVNGAPQTVNTKTVYVKGANNYVVSANNATTDNTVNGMKYDLFYVNNDNANSGDATYTITVVMN